MLALITTLVFISLIAFFTIMVKAGKKEYDNMIKDKHNQDHLDFPKFNNN